MRDNYAGDHARAYDHDQTSENDEAPFDADPVTLVAVTAPHDMRAHERQNKTFPKFSAAACDIIRLTIRTLHYKENYRSCAAPSSQAASDLE